MQNRQNFQVTDKVLRLSATLPGLFAQEVHTRVQQPFNQFTHVKRGQAMLRQTACDGGKDEAAKDVISRRDTMGVELFKRL